MSNRFISEEGEMVSPKDTIKCFDCKHRDKFEDGFKKCICDKYDDILENRKPKEILFDGRDCEFYEKDSD